MERYGASGQNEQLRLVRSLFSSDLVPNCCVLSLVVLGVARERYTARAPQEYTCTSKVFTTQYYKSKQYILLLLIQELCANFYKLIRATTRRTSSGAHSTRSTTPCRSAVYSLRVQRLLAAAACTVALVHCEHFVPRLVHQRACQAQSLHTSRCCSSHSLYAPSPTCSWPTSSSSCCFSTW